MTRTCELCPTILPANSHGARRFCPACYRARAQARNAARRRQERCFTRFGAAAYITAGNAVARMRCDRTLNRGGANRHCQKCYRTYRLETMETPCPNCGDHLVELPAYARVA